MCTFFFFYIGTASRGIILFLGTPVCDNNIRCINCWCDWVSVKEIYGMICIKICMEEVGVFLIFVDFCIPWFEGTLVWDFMSFISFISWVYDRFMWIMHEILHAMFENKEIRFCWVIHLSTEAHGEILNIITGLNIDMHDSNNPVIEIYSMLFLNLFQLFSNYRCIH